MVASELSRLRDAMQSHFKSEYFGKLEDATLLSDINSICKDQVMSGRGAKGGSWKTNGFPKECMGLGAVGGNSHLWPPLHSHNEQHACANTHGMTWHCAHRMRIVWLGRCRG